MNKVTLNDIDVNNKTVLLRVDFNTPMNGKEITDDSRIVASLPTIKKLLSMGAKIIIVSHLGRPDGKVNVKYSLAPVGVRLEKLIGQTVLFSHEVIGNETTKLAKNLKSGEILLLENLRFLKEEEENDSVFAEKLANLADIFVFDAFGTSHRAHASTHGVTKYLPSAVGLLVEKELDFIVNATTNPKRPFTAILGGGKVSDKLGVIKGLLSKVDNLIIGGAMAYTFLKAQGIEVGKSLVENDMIQLAKEILSHAIEKNVNIYLPLDHLQVNDITNPTIINNTIDKSIDKDCIGIDIGEKTIKQFETIIEKSKTIIWNGPVGLFENPLYEKGTYRLALAMSNNTGITIIGGGDSSAAVTAFGLSEKISHVSTGGGATLKLLEGKKLPAIEAIDNK